MIKKDLDIIVLANTNNKHERNSTNQYDLSLIEYRYLQAISLGGSSKQIAQVIQKSPRTIEKQIRDLCKKFKISCKSNLQIYTRALISSFHIKTQTY